VRGLIRLLGFFLLAYAALSIVVGIARMFFPDKFHDRKKRK